MDQVFSLTYGPGVWHMARGARATKKWGEMRIHNLWYRPHTWLLHKQMHTKRMFHSLWSVLEVMDHLIDQSQFNNIICRIIIIKVICRISYSLLSLVLNNTLGGGTRFNYLSGIDD